MTTSAHYTHAIGLMSRGVSAQAAATMIGVGVVDLVGMPVTRPLRATYQPGPRFVQPVAVVKAPRLPPEGSMRSIIEAIAETTSRHGLTAEDVVSPRRSRRYAWPRQEAMTVVRDRFGLSYPDLGIIFGGRDHTTVVAGVRRHRNRMAWADILIAIGGGQ